MNTKKWYHSFLSWPTSRLKAVIVSIMPLKYPLGRNMADIHCFPNFLNTQTTLSHLKDLLLLRRCQPSIMKLLNKCYRFLSLLCFNTEIRQHSYQPIPASCARTSDDTCSWGRAIFWPTAVMYYPGLYSVHYKKLAYTFHNMARIIAVTLTNMQNHVTLREPFHVINTPFAIEETSKIFPSYRFTSSPVH